MTFQFFENDNGVSIELYPQTPEEVATLARIVQNTKAEKPEITFYFSSSPSLSIWMKKVAKVSQTNFLKNGKHT